MMETYVMLGQLNFQRRARSNVLPLRLMAWYVILEILSEEAAAALDCGTAAPDEADFEACFWDWAMCSDLAAA